MAVSLIGCFGCQKLSWLKKKLWKKSPSRTVEQRCRRILLAQAVGGCRAPGAGREDGVKGGSVLSRLLGDVVTSWVFLGSLCRRMGWPWPVSPSAGGVGYCGYPVFLSLPF